MPVHDAWQIPLGAGAVRGVVVDSQRVTYIVCQQLGSVVHGERIDGLKHFCMTLPT